MEPEASFVDPEGSLEKALSFCISTLIEKDRRNRGEGTGHVRMIRARDALPNLSSAIEQAPRLDEIPQLDINVGKVVNERGQPQFVPFLSVLENPNRSFIQGASACVVGLKTVGDCQIVEQTGDLWMRGPVASFRNTQSAFLQRPGFGKVSQFGGGSRKVLENSRNQRMLRSQRTLGYIKGPTIQTILRLRVVSFEPELITEEIQGDHELRVDRAAGLADSKGPLEQWTSPGVLTLSLKNQRELFECDREPRIGRREVSLLDVQRTVQRSLSVVVTRDLKLCPREIVQNYCGREFLRAFPLLGEPQGALEQWDGWTDLAAGDECVTEIDERRAQFNVSRFEERLFYSKNSGRKFPCAGRRAFTISEERLDEEIGGSCGG